MVNGAFTALVRSRAIGARYEAFMEAVFIPGRPALDDAQELIERFGEQAHVEASVRAARSRADGNLARFCHWRQIQRVVAVLLSNEPRGTVH
jgi:hypothetical protein